jgi:hypothetical protein
MRTLLMVASAAVFFLVTSLASADVGVNVNIGIPQPVVIAEAPEFIFAPTLGFYVAVGVPYDIVLISNSYYLYRGNVWYRAPYYNGPWVVTKYRSLPPKLRKHKFERIRSVRDQEYRVYQADRDHYRGKRFRPDKEWKQERKQEQREMKEERKMEKEERKQGGGKQGGGKHGKD